MKPLLTFLFAILFFYFSVAQSVSAVNCRSPLQCKNDLRDTFFSAANIDTLTYLYANPNSVSPNFHDVAYASGSCAAINSCSNDTSILKYKVYYPSPRVFNYGSCKLPLMVVFHAGSFADCNGTYNTSDMKTLCLAFAQRGFITISVNYRTGVQIVPGRYGDYFSAQQMLAIWRAGQDARGALRSIIKRERNGREPYRIDTNNLFTGGKSSGSVLALNLAFYNKNTMLSSAFAGIDNSKMLGQINQNYYYGSTTINYTIKGVLDMWGGAIIPQTSDSSYLKIPENYFFTAGNNMPAFIAFQGAKDKTFNYRYQALEFPPASIASGLYSTESYCLNTPATYTPYTTNNPDGWILGAQNIYDMYKRKGMPAELYIDCDMGHGLELNGDFGLANHKADTVNNYIVQRACIFFQAVANGTAGSLTTTRFVNCENYRSQCSLADNNNNCSNNNDCTGNNLVTRQSPTEKRSKNRRLAFD